MYQALYRKYRPSSFDEVVGQDIIKKIILNEINSNKISHAYLFCGPRGTGKTSIAKLIAKLINCEHQKNGKACGKCNSCIQFENKNYVDIIEIDAASNNGVDEIRELRNKANLLPATSKYKIYIIDEVHMLSIGAFNALLKTLEEPPKHVIFILATTEINKIPITIISRCQRFDFNKIPEQQIVERLKYICEKEQIKITDDALQSIASLTDGGMRDSIGLLDKSLAYTTEIITEDIIHLVYYTLTKKEIGQLFDMLYTNNIEEYINYIEKINDRGIDLLKVVDELMKYLRDIILSKIENNYDFNRVLVYINELNELSNKMKITNYPKILLETFIILVNQNNNVKLNLENSNESKKIDIKNSKIIQNKKNEIQTQQTLDITQNDEPRKEKEKKLETKTINNLEELINIRVNNVLATCNKQCLNELKNKWRSISQHSISPIYGMSAGILLDADLGAVSNTNIIVTYPYKSMADRANNDIPTIEKLLKIVFKKDYKFIALVQNDWNKFKNDYIKKLKANEEYNYINEDVNYSTIFGVENTEIVDQAVEIFGNELVQVI